MRELTSDDIDLVVGGSPGSPGILSGNVVRLFTDAANGASQATPISDGQAILHFKQHKDGPTQIPIGTPISLEFIAAALLFLPTINS
jgi:intracellular multiplication protein IcmD